jgi:tRNA U34 5-carboxymethylaminomethyl modifying GTPase MnmE/TrmE
MGVSSIYILFIVFSITGAQESNEKLKLQLIVAKNDLQTHKDDLWQAENDSKLQKQLIAEKDLHIEELERKFKHQISDTDSSIRALEKQVRSSAKHIEELEKKARSAQQTSSPQIVELQVLLGSYTTTKPKHINEILLATEGSATLVYL